MVGSISSFNRKKSSKVKQSSPMLYSFTDNFDWTEKEVKLRSIKEEFAYLYKHYMVEGKN